MSDNLALEFPVLQPDQDNFSPGIEYTVAARRHQNRDGRFLTITHILIGRSFIRELLENGNACFSVAFLYKNSSECQYHSCDLDSVIQMEDGSGITAVQTVPQDFSYAPEIKASILSLKDSTLLANSESGLTEFWKDESFTIPQYARIAFHPTMKFTDGALSNLMEVELDEKIDPKEMKVRVSEFAAEGRAPVTVECGLKIFAELHRINDVPPKTLQESMRSSLVTAVLCSVYGYMRMINNQQKDFEETATLKAHLEEMEERAGMSWKDDEFDPALAATKMYPYGVFKDNE